jgi:hypothetical protein
VKYFFATSAVRPYARAAATYGSVTSSNTIDKYTVYGLEGGVGLVYAPFAAPGGNPAAARFEYFLEAGVRVTSGGYTIEDGATEETETPAMSIPIMGGLVWKFY